MKYTELHCVKMYTQGYKCTKNTLYHKVETYNRKHIKIIFSFALYNCVCYFAFKFLTLNNYIISAYTLFILVFIRLCTKVSFAFFNHL